MWNCPITWNSFNESGIIPNDARNYIIGYLEDNSWKNIIEQCQSPQEQSMACIIAVECVMDVYRKEASSELIVALMKLGNYFVHKFAMTAHGHHGTQRRILSVSVYLLNKMKCPNYEVLDVLVDTIGSFLGKLKRMLSEEEDDDFLFHVVSKLAELIRFSFQDSATQMLKIWDLVYEAFAVLSVDHLKPILEELIPVITESSPQCSQRAVRFLTSISDRESWDKNMMIFLQHLVIQGSKQLAKSRKSTSIAISTLFECLNHEDRLKFVTFLTRVLKNKIPGRRTFAMECLSEISFHIGSNQPHQSSSDAESRLELITLILPSWIERFSDISSSVRSKALLSFSKYLEINGDVFTSFVQQNGTNAFSLSHILKRVYDSKSPVRKAAVQTIGQLIELCPEQYLTSDVLSVLQNHALDASILNKKQILSIFTRLNTKFPANLLLLQQLFQVLLVLGMDQESSVALKAQKMLKKLVLDQILKDSDIIWNMFNACSNNDIDKFFRILKKMNSKESLSEDLMDQIESHLRETTDSVTSWKLMDQIVEVYENPDIDGRFIVEEYQRLEDVERTPTQSQIFFHAVNILSKIGGFIDKDSQEMLAESIVQKLKDFEISPTLIQPYVNGLVKMCHSLKTSLRELHKEILSNEFYQRFCALFTEDGQIGDEKIIRFLVTIGVVALAFPKYPVPQKFITLVQGLIATSFALGNTNHRQVSSAVRSHAFVTLGKLCLVNESLTRKTEPVFIREIQKAEEDTVRNNILITMCDLCVKYSRMGRFTSTIAESMRDQSLLVRRHATRLLTQLLAEDFIKWEPILLFRFLTLISDDDEITRETAKYTIRNVLSRKKPQLLYHHFIEAIYVLNNCREHHEYNQFSQSKREIERFSLQHKQEQRRAVWTFILQELLPEQKLKLHATLHTEVLSNYSEKNYKDEVVLSDILWILSQKPMKITNETLQQLTQKKQKNEQFSEFNTALLDKFLQRHMSENVFPNLIELKDTLEKRKSPKLRELSEYLHLISQQYKNELKDLLKGHQTLMKELEFDFQKQQQKRSPRKSLIGIKFTSPLKQFTPPKQTSLQLTPTKKFTTTPPNQSKFRSPLANIVNGNQDEMDLSEFEF